MPRSNSSFPVAAIYLALTAVSELTIRWLDKRFSVGVVKE